MKVYLYAKSGHTIGLDETKRCSVIANILNEFEPILCISDFRAGIFAKENLGVKKYVNIDVVRNLHNIMEKGDILIYDTSEVNEEMKKEMKEFSSLLYEIGKEIDGIIVDELLYSKVLNPKLEKTIFFGDDDYNNFFLEMVKDSKKYEINLLIGHYFFLGNEKIFDKHFANVIDEEEYVETIKDSKYLLTASLQTALESLACGNKPVLFKREDKIYDEKLIEKLNLPVIEANDLKDLLEKFDTSINEYPIISNFNIISLENIKEEIKEKIDLYNKLTR